MSKNKSIIKLNNGPKFEIIPLNEGMTTIEVLWYMKVDPDQIEYIIKEPEVPPDLLRVSK